VRIKVTISMEPFEKKTLDERAKELNLTRSGYIKMLVHNDTKKEQKKYADQQREAERVKR
jgi:hypothetical protein